MNKNQFKIRRAMAIAAFVLISLTLLSVLLIASFGSAVVVENLNDINPIITPITVCFTGIIAHYMKLVNDADKFNAGL